jgi:hypothetical protein
MFSDAKTLECYGLWNKESVEDWSENFTSNIQILRTPGHDHTGITLFVKTGPESGYPGIVAICGDIFWKEDYPQDPRDDAYASDPEKLKESRDMVLKMANWVIPGHGPMYKAKKGQTEESMGQASGSKKAEQKVGSQCKKCHRLMKQKDKCACRPWLCYNCCECGLDCDLCGCSHKS